MESWDRLSLSKLPADNARDRLILFVKIADIHEASELDWYEIHTISGI